MTGSQRVAWFLLQQVIGRVLPGETGAQRAQQVAVLMTIWAHQDREAPITAQQIADLYGFVPAQISKLLKRLADRGLIEREQVHQQSGRGVMYLLRVRETEELRALKAELEVSAI